MPRPQAADYAERRAAIVEGAAGLYAEHGFRGASVADLAARLGSSKALIYHYFSSKEDILFEVMDQHLRALDVAAEAVAARADAPAQTLRDLARAFMAHYAGAQARHRVLLNELAALPPGRRAEIVGRQRRLIAIVERLVARLQPELEPRLRRPAAMLFFGMINWTHTWFDPGGAVSGTEIADLASTLMLRGLALEAGSR
ncbi:MAG TPA: TetR/AcrR family transcriptional regulator [Caulobacteraceae bacterium]